MRAVSIDLFRYSRFSLLSSFSGYFGYLTNRTINGLIGMVFVLFLEGKKLTGLQLSKKVGARSFWSTDSMASVIRIQT